MVSSLHYSIKNTDSSYHTLSLQERDQTKNGNMAAIAVLELANPQFQALAKFKSDYMTL